MLLQTSTASESLERQSSCSDGFFVHLTFDLTALLPHFRKRVSMKFRGSILLRLFSCPFIFLAFLTFPRAVFRQQGSQGLTQCLILVRSFLPVETVDLVHCGVLTRRMCSPGQSLWSAPLVNCVGKWIFQRKQGEALSKPSAGSYAVFSFVD